MKNYKELLADNKAWIEETFKLIDEKMSKVTLRSANVLVDGVDASGRHRTRVANTWTSSFWGALNYLLYEHTKNEDYLTTARNSERLMDEGLKNFDKLHHDVGFMWDILSAAGYRITGDEDSRRRALFAAATLSSRFVLSGGFIRSWNGFHMGGDTANWTIIDCLMNLPLLYFASNEIGDDRYKQVAMAHADMAILDHIREDGSVAHIVEHDRQTGELVRTYAGQGCAEGSSWSRGQAWALYGMMLSYIYTSEERYLDAAKRVAHYFIANVCDDWLPRVDFRAPSEPVMYDSTAGAIAACGLIELAKALPEGEGGMYASAAINMLKAMREKFMNFDPNTDDMLNYGTMMYPIDGNYGAAGVHMSIIYGDYFYTEAILKLLGSEFNPW